MKLLSTIYACSEDLNVIHRGFHPLHDFYERNLPWGTKNHIKVCNCQSMELLSTISACGEDLNMLNAIHQGSHPLHDFHERNLPWGTKTISPKPYLTAVTF